MIFLLFYLLGLYIFSYFLVEYRLVFICTPNSVAVMVLFTSVVRLK